MPAMKNENVINCPQCGAKIDVNEILYQQLEGQIKKQFDKQNAEREKKYEIKLKNLEDQQKEIEQEKERLKDKVDAEVRQTLRNEKQKLEKNIRSRIEEEKSEELKVLQNELQEKSNKLKELNKTKAEAEKLRREKEELHEQFEKEREQLRTDVEKEIRQKLKNEKLKFEQALRLKIEEERSEELKNLQNELQEKSKQLKDLNKTRAEVEKLKREKDELHEQITLEKEKELNLRLEEEKLKIKKKAEEGNFLKIKEREKIIEDLKNQLDEAKRKAEQGSVQLQGEIQELEIEKLLRTLYCIYGDKVEEIKKGQRGADILHTVFEHGAQCGRIYYESKRAKDFQPSWLQKLKNDNASVKADILVLVSAVLPNGNEKFAYDERTGIWLCAFSELKGLSLVLRHGLMQVNRVAQTHQDRGSKMELLYGYLTSQEFRGQFEAIIDGFKNLQDSYSDEKLKMQKIWKEREKQLEIILANAVNFYGALRGTAGASIPKIRALESNKVKLLEE